MATDQIFYRKPYAKIYQTDKTNCMDKAVRIYRDSPYTITLQVRSHTDKRGQIATATVTRQEALEIAAYLTRKAAELSEESAA